ncbi:hypothetical protein [Staphylospora marina]|uniref:hypothetical protein n=1 Tax=Staphylospora marina TaxID=2490858 RepID=UPI0013DE1C1D|nr:hypothetical protein [Staphylospora marina]
MIRVKMPERIDGRMMAVLLRSLADQIRTEHLNKPVKSLRIDKEAREIRVEFKEEEQ